MNSQSCSGPSPTPSTKQREPYLLAQPLSKRLLAYVTMAGASAAACVSHAEAEVVYTPVHQNVNLLYFLDLNHDGNPDFLIASYYFIGVGYLRVEPVNTSPRNGIVGERGGCMQKAIGAAALPDGVMIGPSLFRGGGNLHGVVVFSRPLVWREKSLPGFRV